MRDVARNALVPWKDQQNFSPFTEGVVPNTDNYKLALRFYADKAEFPIMPSYTANQFDKAEAHGGRPRRDEQLLQHQLDPAGPAVREGAARLPVRLHHAGHVPQPARVGELERVRQRRQPLPRQQRVLLQLEPGHADARALGHPPQHPRRFNFMIIDDIAGLRPRLDGAVELWPIDVGWDHYLVDNLSYHGSDLSIVWDKPGDDKRYYGDTPEGMSVYVDGRRAFTVDDIAHVRWDSASGTVSVLDGSDTQVAYSTGAPARAATEQTSLSDNARVVDMFQKAGTDLDPRDRHADATSRRARPATRLVHDHHADAAGDGAGERGRRLHDQRPAGDSRARLPGPQPDLGHAGLAERAGLARARPRRADPLRHGEAVLLRQQAVRDGRQHLPHAVGLQPCRYHNGTDWVDVPGQSQEPGRAAGRTTTRSRSRRSRRSACASCCTRTGHARRSASRSSSSSTPARKTDRSRAVSAAPCRATLSLTLGTPAQFGAFTPGVARDVLGEHDRERDLAPPVTRR